MVFLFDICTYFIPGDLSPRVISPCCRILRADVHVYKSKYNKGLGQLIERYRMLKNSLTSWGLMVMPWMPWPANWLSCLALSTCESHIWTCVSYLFFNVFYKKCLCNCRLQSCYHFIFRIWLLAIAVCKHVLYLQLPSTHVF